MKRPNDDGCLWDLVPPAILAMPYIVIAYAVWKAYDL